jgi:hypothetical protein
MRLILILLVVSLNSNLIYADPLQLKENIRVSCSTLEGLKKGLDRVVDEMQVYNNDKDIWQSRDGCSIVTGRSFTAEREIARQAYVFKASTLGGFIGWIKTDKWLVPIEHIAYTDRTKEKAFRPADILSLERYSLPEICFKRRTIEVFGVTIVGHQFSAGHPSDEFGRRHCAVPIVVYQRVKQGGRGDTRNRRQHDWRHRESWPH